MSKKISKYNVDGAEFYRVANILCPKDKRVWSATKKLTTKNEVIVACLNKLSGQKYLDRDKYLGKIEVIFNAIKMELV